MSYKVKYVVAKATGESITFDTQKEAEALFESHPDYVEFFTARVYTRRA